MNRRRWVWLIVGAVAVVGLAVGAYFLWQANRNDELPPMPLLQEEDGTSEDVTADIKRMWQTQTMKGNSIDPPPNSKASTDDAVNSASRVFNTVKLIGLTRDEVIALLGDPKKSNDSVYNFPWYSAPKGSLVYRFDAGAGGWQFNVLFDRDGRVRDVQRYGIE